MGFSSICRFGSGNHTLYSGPPVADVLRNFVIDLGMFAVSLSALIVTAVTVAQLRKQPKLRVHQASVQSHGSEETDLSTSPEPAANEELQSVSHSDEEEERPASVSTTSAKSHSTSVQQPFIQVPPDLLFLLEVAFIFFLVLSASAVPSLIAAVYMLIFLLLALLWSIHVDVPILKVAIWIVTMALVGIHLVVLYVFQLQSVQVSNSSYSLALRYVGLHTHVRMYIHTYTCTLTHTVRYTNCDEEYRGCLLLSLCKYPNAPLYGNCSSVHNWRLEVYYISVNGQGYVCCP